MHLYIAIRGTKDRVDRWINDCLACYVPYKHKKGEKPGSLQLGMRPIYLYEVVFPEPELKTVLETIYPYGWMETKNKGFRAAFAMIRKMLGARKLPDKKNIKYNRRILNLWVDVAGIGIKKDKYNKEGVEML